MGMDKDWKGVLQNDNGGSDDSGYGENIIFYI